MNCPYDRTQTLLTLRQARVLSPARTRAQPSLAYATKLR